MWTLNASLLIQALCDDKQTERERESHSVTTKEKVTIVSDSLRLIKSVSFGEVLLLRNIQLLFLCSAAGKRRHRAADRLSGSGYRLCALRAVKGAAAEKSLDNLWLHSSVSCRNQPIVSKALRGFQHLGFSFFYPRWAFFFTLFSQLFSYFVFVNADLCSTDGSISLQREYCYIVHFIMN